MLCPNVTRWKSPMVYAIDKAHSTQLELAEYGKSVIYVSAKTEQGLDKV